MSQEAPNLKTIIPRVYEWAGLFLTGFVAATALAVTVINLFSYATNAKVVAWFVSFIAVINLFLLVSYAIFAKIVVPKVRPEYTLGHHTYTFTKLGSRSATIPFIAGVNVFFAVYLLVIWMVLPATPPDPFSCRATAASSPTLATGRASHGIAVLSDSHGRWH